MYVLLSDNLDKIGIDLIDGGTDWVYFILRAYGYVPGGYDDLQLFWIGWSADYNDPVNILNVLFSNISVSNGAQVNDPYLEGLMQQGVEETDPILRKQMAQMTLALLQLQLFPLT